MIAGNMIARKLIAGNMIVRKTIARHTVLMRKGEGVQSPSPLFSNCFYKMFYNNLNFSGSPPPIKNRIELHLY